MHPMRNASRSRVLHVFGSLQRGGAEMRTLEVLRLLDRDRFDFGMVALSGQRGELAPVAEADGIDIEVCALGKGFGRRFTDLLQRLDVDVLHSHVHYASGYLLWLAKRAGVRRRIAHFRNTSDGQGNGLRRRVQRAVMRRLIEWYATDILAVSEGTMAEAWGPDWNRDPRCRVIFNGLDTSRFEAPVAAGDVRREFGWAADVPFFINVASFQPAKNQIRVVEVFQAIAERNPEARLLFVGREVNGYQASVRAAVNRLGLDDRVVFAGERSDVPRLLKAADVLLFPSRWEGLPGRRAGELRRRASGRRQRHSRRSGNRPVFSGGSALSSVPEQCGLGGAGTAAASPAESAATRRSFDQTPFALGRAAQLVECRLRTSKLRNGSLRYAMKLSRINQDFDPRQGRPGPRSAGRRVRRSR